MVLCTTSLSVQSTIVYFHSKIFLLSQSYDNLARCLVHFVTSFASEMAMLDDIARHLFLLYFHHLLCR